MAPANHRAKPIRLPEYGADDKEVPRATAMAIRAAADGRLTVSATDDAGTWRFQAGSHVGTIVVPGQDVVITPKVRTANLFHLLGWATGIGFDPDELFGYDTQKDLLAAMASVYARTLDRSLARGVVHRYVEHQDRLVALRGRVDVVAGMRRGGLPSPIECRYDEYTSDIPLNRIVRGAATALLRVASLRPTVRQSLMRSLSRLDGVSAVQAGDLRARIQWTRLDAHARPAELLARPILDRLSLDHEVGTSSAPAFLVDMNTVFEQYLENQLRVALGRRGYDVAGQYATPLDVCEKVGMRPDIVVLRGKVPVFVADAKYKLTPSGLGRDRDYYQLLAYCQALGLRQGALVYCHDDGDPPSGRCIEVVKGGPRLRTEMLALSGTPAEIDARVDDLAGQIVRWIEGSGDAREGPAEMIVAQVLSVGTTAANRVVGG